MCKYINFNNLRKKKEFTDGDVVDGWSSSLYQEDTPKEEKETKKNILFFK